MILRLSVTIALAVVLATLTTALSACTATEAQLDAHATRVAEEIYASLDVGATIPPSTRELTPSEIYTRIAPSIAYIGTEYSTGSGFLVADEDGQRYVVTNMHVLWPADSARVVFPRGVGNDGIEFEDVPLVGWDLMLDLAVLGPIETDRPPSPLGNGEALAVGSDIYLIGYPNEEQLFPQPALVHGLISRQREQTATGLTYFQTDAPIMGGQSGGVMVAADGAVIGVTGSSFGEVFALAMSTSDLERSIYGLVAGEDVDGLSARLLPARSLRRLPRLHLENQFDTRMFVLNEEAGVEFEVSATSDNNVGLLLADMNGSVTASASDTVSGTETLSTTIFSAAPHFLIVEQYDITPGDVRIKSNTKLALFEDEDDGRTLDVGAQIVANMDYPLDIDTFLVELEAGQTVIVAGDTDQFDVEVSMGALDDESSAYSYDDDSGDGAFGTNARLTFTAPDAGVYLIVVRDVFGDKMGGYRLAVELADGQGE